MRVTDYLGGHVSTLLAEEPFNNWPFKRSIPDDPGEKAIYYTFGGHGLQLLCDADETIVSIFVLSEGPFSEVPFSSRREEVLERFGTPSKSGPKWDRFSRPHSTIHISYRADADAIKLITLMHPDVVP